MDSNESILSPLPPPILRSLSAPLSCFLDVKQTYIYLRDLYYKVIINSRSNSPFWKDGVNNPQAALRTPKTYTSPPSEKENKHTAIINFKKQAARMPFSLLSGVFNINFFFFISEQNLNILIKNICNKLDGK